MYRSFASLPAALAAAIVFSLFPDSLFAEDIVRPLRSELLMEFSADIEDPQAVGDTPHGLRRIVYFRGGDFSGPSLRGKVLAGGGDWLTVRKDGMGQIDVRTTLRTDDGALIYVTYGGLLDLPAAVRDRILSGEQVSTSEYYLRSLVLFETAAPRYAWLNRVVAVGVGERTRTGVAYSIHVIR